MPRRKVADRHAARARLARRHDRLPPALRQAPERVDVYFEDGSMVSLERRLARGGDRAPARPPHHRDRPRVVETPRSSRRSARIASSRATSSCAPASDRPTTSTSTASRPCPSCSSRSALAWRPRRPSSSRTRSGSRAPSSARSRWPRRPRSPPASPFVIVRGKAKEYGTANQLGGRLRGRRSCHFDRRCGHIGRCGRRCRPGSTASCLGMPHGHLRHRPGGGRSRRPCSSRRALVSTVSCGGNRRGRTIRKAAWLSGNRASIRYLPVVQLVQRRSPR